MLKKKKKKENKHKKKNVQQQQQRNEYLNYLSLRSDYLAIYLKKKMLMLFAKFHQNLIKPLMIHCDLMKYEFSKID